MRNLMREEPQVICEVCIMATHGKFFTDSKTGHEVELTEFTNCLSKIII